MRSHDSRSLIVADADPESRSQSLFKISTDTGEKRRITRALTSSMGDDSPSVSADGRTLAFVRSPTIAASDIYLLPLAAQTVSESTPRRLTVENGYLYNPMWTPDGRDILYVTYLDGNTVIKRIPVQGGGQPEVVFTVGQRATSTALSPDGGRLVYAAAQDDLDIAVLSLNGDSLHPNPPHRLLSSTRTDMSPQISPDGTRIAFASRRSGPMESVCSSAVQARRSGPDSQIDGRTGSGQDWYAALRRRLQPYRFALRNSLRNLPCGSH